MRCQIIYAYINKFCGVIILDELLQVIIETKKIEIKELIYANFNFLMNYHGYQHKQTFFKVISKDLDIPKRRLYSWYYKEKLPKLSTSDIIKLTNYFHISFSDFISTKISENNLNNDFCVTYTPSDIAKKKILTLLIQYDIKNPKKFETFFESNYSYNYFYVLNRKHRHKRNLSWNFIITASYYLNISVKEIFLLEEREK